MDCVTFIKQGFYVTNQLKFESSLRAVAFESFDGFCSKSAGIVIMHVQAMSVRADLEFHADISRVNSLMKCIKKKVGGYQLS